MTNMQWKTSFVWDCIKGYLMVLIDRLFDGGVMYTSRLTCGDTTKRPCLVLGLGISDQFRDDSGRVLNQ